MKVKLRGYNTLRRTIELEGDSIVEKDEDLFLDENIEGSITTVAAEALGFSFGIGDEAYMVTKRYNSGWDNQTYISYALRTLMNNDLGFPLEVGRAGRYIQDKICCDHFEKLNSLLDEMNYFGFISLKFNADNNLIDVLFGAGLALYGMLEGVSGKISSFFKDSGKILESWSVALVLSRYPYPFKPTCDRLFFDLPPSVAKHLWFFDLKGFRKGFYTDKTAICIVSAWATSLNEAARRVYRTCQGLDVPLKQYRTDVAPYISNLWTLKPFLKLNKQ